MENNIDKAMRKMRSPLFIFMALLGILCFILNLPAYFGVALYQQQYIGMFITLFLLGTFISIPLKKGKSFSWLDIILAFLSIPAGLYIAVLYPQIQMSLWKVDIARTIAAGLTILLIIEALRRTIGWAITIIAAVFLIYARFASILPGILNGRPISTPQLLNYIYTDPNSLLWMISFASAIGIGFIIFGQFMINFGGGRAFINIALSLCGRMRGAGAKAAVVSSSLVGTITGAPMANVLLTGSVTIPMMKEMGYPPHKAAAVEAVASSGGQIMPPVMGIAAFIIADTLGVPYAKVALAAALPAILFYLAVYAVTDLDAGNMGMKGLKPELIPKWLDTLRTGWVIFPGIAFLLYTLFVANQPPALCAIDASLVSLPFFALLKENQKGFFKKLIGTLEESGKLIVNIGVIMSAAGLIVGAINASGVAFNLTLVLTQLASKSVFLLLLSAAVTSLILGMGMPSVAAYTLVAVLVAPSLVNFGILPMAAHLFVFYFAVISNITPPVAVSCFAAAPLAGANLMKTGYEACRIAIASYIVPFIFVFEPPLLLYGTVGEIIFAFISLAIGLIAISIAVTGFWTKKVSVPQRLILFVGSAFMLFPNLGALMRLVGLIVIIGGLIPDIIELMKRSRLAKTGSVNLI